MAAKKKGKGKGKKKEEEKTKARNRESLLSHAFVKAAKKEYGEATIGEAHRLTPGRISTGISQVDRALGGGLTVGEFHTFYGPESGGKTTTCLRVIGNAQLTCRHCYTNTRLTPGKCECGNFEPHICAYIKLEEWHPDWAERFLDIDELALCEPVSAEEALDILEALIRTGECDLIVMDSVAFLTPKKEIEDSVSKDNPALQARQLGKGVRKAITALKTTYLDKKVKPLLLFTNQIRMNVGVMFGSPETKSGGKALVFAASTETRFRTVDVKIDDATGMTLHSDHEAVVKKNKTGSPAQKAVFRQLAKPTDLKKKGEIYDEMWLVSEAKKFNLLIGSGDDGTKAPWYLFEEKYKSQTQLEEALAKDRELHHALTTALFQVYANLQDGMKDNEIDGPRADEDPALEQGEGESEPLETENVSAG